MRRNIGRKILWFSVLAVVAVIVFANFTPAVEKFKREVAGISQVVEGLRSIKELNFFNQRLDVVLSEENIVILTNAKRSDDNLSKLTPNAVLDNIAKKRLDDMVENQYFSHNSPINDRGVEEEAKETGYEYISIGENIAMGDFESDEDLVNAWMESPGHRENILSEKFTQIGVAVANVSFKGKTTWMAVQVFSRPLSDCAEPNMELKELIKEQKVKIEVMVKHAESFYAEMSRKRDEGDIEYFNQKVPAYNSQIKQINNELDYLKTIIDKYNNEVRTFNKCLKN